ncbi:MAG TPA: toll/interleukin-1 receptor domain-containing protein [Rhizomicrobium sp.]|jgi:tetratricopeptide (TPR) repeat protein|nr:toll/interleukin-1 receptor domain-containing protein [Rhizomicrobium sp.]
MGEPYKYRAFISYNHRDQKWGEWLRRALESYRVPRRLVGAPGRDGPIPARLFPVYRDREETPTSADLSEQIQDALAQSAYLIVICSPHAVASRWVNEEIQTFKRLGRANRILAIIVDGEPNAGDKPPILGPDGVPLTECFPEALRYHLDADDTLSPERTEPVAADARRQGDGRQNAKLKLIAGLLGVGYDDLKQRDREARRVRIAIRSVAAACFAVLAIVAGVSFWISEAMADNQKDALDQHLIGIVSQMDRIGVPRFGVQTFINLFDSQSRIMAYGANSTERLNQRVSVLMASAYFYSTTGDWRREEDCATEAMVVLRELFHRDPNDITVKERLANAIMQVGDAELAQGHYEMARAEFMDAFKLSTIFLAGEDKNLAEDFGRGRLDAVAGDLMHELSAPAPLLSDNEKTLFENIVSAFSAAIDADLAQNKLEAAWGDAMISDYFLDALARGGAKDDEAFSEELVATAPKIGKVLLLKNEPRDALAFIKNSAALLNDYYQRDPQSVSRMEALGAVLAQQGDVYMQMKNFDEARESYLKSIHVTADLMGADPGKGLWQRQRAATLIRLGQCDLARFEVAAAQDDFAKARENLVSADGMSDAEKQRLLHWLDGELHSLSAPSAGPPGARN